MLSGDDSLRASDHKYEAGNEAALFACLKFEKDDFAKDAKHAHKKVPDGTKGAAMNGVYNMILLKAQGDYGRFMHTAPTYGNGGHKAVTLLAYNTFMGLSAELQQHFGGPPADKTNTVQHKTSTNTGNWASKVQVRRRVAG